MFLTRIKDQERLLHEWKEVTRLDLGTVDEVKYWYHRVKSFESKRQSYFFHLFKRGPVLVYPFVPVIYDFDSKSSVLRI